MSTQQVMPNYGQPLEVAVVGTGIAGMSAAWLLSSKHNVTVYEKKNRIGGHSNTVDVELCDKTIPVDTGFIVYNEPNYPNLTALFRHFQVSTIDSEMSFSASLRGGTFEYSGTNLNSILGQRRNIFNIHFWQMISDIHRFYRDAPLFIDQKEAHSLSLGEYLKVNNYRDAFVKDHLLPMGAAIWSTAIDDLSQYPALAFIQFFVSHGLLTLNARPKWKTVDGGSREYIRRLISSFAHRIQHQAVMKIKRNKGSVFITDISGKTQRYDHVIISTHADDARKLIVDADSFETKHLKNWRYSTNRAVLHRDASLMPRQRRVWSSWNFIDGSKENSENSCCITYWLNRLQSLPVKDNIFVTLNPIREPETQKLIREFEYNHPIFDKKVLISQRQLWSLQGHRQTWYCGSYFGYGFHEDALQSGLAVAENLGKIRRPWSVPNESGRIHIATQEPAPV